MDYSIGMLERLQSFRQDETLCDVTLKCKNSEYFAHRVILSAASEYFRGLFTVDMIGKNSSKINMQEITPYGIKVCLCYIYSGGAEIDLNYVEEILNASCFLQLWGLKDLCFSAMEDNLNATTCIEFYELAKFYEGASFAERCWGYVKESAIQGDVDYRSVTPSTVKKLFCSDDLNINSERVLFSFLVQWTNSNKGEVDKTRFCKLLQNIRLPTLPPQFLKSVVLKETLVDSCTTCREYANASLKYAISNKQSNLKSVQISVRQQSLMVISRDVDMAHLCNANQRSCRTLALPRVQVSTDCNSVCRVGDCLFVMGGVRNKRCFKMRINVDNEWNEVSSMLHVHNNAGWSGSASLNREIVVFGGRNEHDYSKKCEVYDTTTDSWSDLPDMKEKRANMALVAHGQIIFAIGGKNSSKILSSVECLNIRTKESTKLPDLNEARLGASAVLYKNNIVVLGGWNRCVLDSCELYDAKSGVWTNLPRMKCGRYIFGSAVIGGRIYVFGGCDESASTVEVLHCTTNNWMDVDWDISKKFCKVI